MLRVKVANAKFLRLPRAIFYAFAFRHHVQRWIARFASKRRFTPGFETAIIPG